MNDRFINGLIAGLIAGNIASLIDYAIVTFLKFGSIRFIDFAGVFMYGTRPANLPEQIFAQFGVCIFTSLIGILFAFLITKITSKYLLYKGTIYGALLWFKGYALIELYNVPHFHRTSLSSSVENASVAMIYGFLMAAILNMLQNRQAIK